VFEALRAKLKPQVEPEPAKDANAGASGAFTLSPDGTDFVPSSNVKRAPGEFTMEFLSGFDHEKRAGDHSAAAAGAAIENHTPSLSTGRLFTYSADGKTLERRQESVTEITGGNSAKSDGRLNVAELANVLPSSSTQPEPKLMPGTPPDITSGQPDASGAGEFTDFFQGPFGGERPSATPDLSLPVAKPEQTGDFTRMFGRMKEGSAPDADETQTFNRDSWAGAGEGTFTKLSDNPEGSAKGPAVYQPEPEMAEGVDTREPRFSGVTDWPSRTTGPSVSNSAADKAVPSRSSTSNLLQDAEPPFTSRHEAEGATRVFSGPQSNPQLDLSSLPAGPSEYTRIISGGVKPPIPSQEPPAVPGSQNGPSVNMTVPSVPSLPSLPASPVPMSSAYPQMPSVPSVAAPSVPQLPQPGMAAPTATGPTPWALIIILNVLFILAVALVLYFALKH
jgi:hypothetical protein